MRLGSAFGLGSLGLFVIAIGRVFGLLEMYVVGTGLIVTALLAALVTRSRTVLVSVERRPSVLEPQVGQDTFIELNVNALRRTPAFEVHDHVRDSIFESSGRVEIPVPPLHRGERAASRYRIRTERRGVVTLGPATVEYGDPIGLVRHRRAIGSADEIIVRPEWTRISLPSPRECEGELISAIAALTRSHSSEIEFRSLREYSPGDDVRFVNWKASARRDVLIVNEFESRTDVVAHVFVDDFMSAYTDEGFERAIRCAASFVGSTTYSTPTDVRTKLTVGHDGSHGFFDALVDETSNRDAMRSLALITPSNRESRPRSSSERSAVTIPIIICGRRGGEWLERIREMMNGTSLAIVVSCDGPPPPDLSAGWFAIDCTDLTSFAQQWARLSRTVTGI